MSAQPVRGARWGALLRELRAPDDEGGAAVLEERRRRNLARLGPGLAVMALVHAVHVVLFLVDGPTSTDPMRVEWHQRILFTHALYLPLSILGALVAWRGERVAAQARASLPLPELVAGVYLVFGAVLATFDQAVTSAVTPYLGTTIGIAVSLRMSARMGVLQQAAGFVIFALGQVLAQSNPDVRLSNLVNGSSLAAFAAVLGIVLTRAERRDVLQQRLILQQKRDLEEALERVRELAERAEAANRAKGTFLGSMSHEVRTPLNAILGIASILEDELADPQHRAWLATMQQSGRTLLALLEDLLVMSRLEAQRFELRPGPCDPGAVVEQVCAAFEPSVREKGLRLDVEVGPEVPRLVTADDVRLRQIAFNLVGNAIKFTARGSVSARVHAKAAELPGHVDLRFEVEDTGRGIPPEERARVFEAFFQGRRDKTETKPDGTGLGLAISHRLVGLMGGHIELDSTLGQGSVFTVCLPNVELRAPQR